MASKCLVEFRDKKIVVNFDGSLTRQQLFDNLQASGVIVNVDTARLRLRVYDKDFSTFVDVTDDFVIKDKFKVQLHEVSEYRHPAKLYEERAKALVRKFPNLADYIRTGYDSWREALRFKGKYERRQIWIHRGETVPTKKHRSDGTLTIYEPVLRKVTRPTTVTEVRDSEDESGVKSHITLMKKELAKTKPDLFYVTDCMLRTFIARRN
ncbi:hypothetical protein MRX96_017526 [Rhipicephalus microplus]